jgi:hypothetical protein
MAAEISEKELYRFLADWKTRDQIQERFNLSPTQLNNLLNWLRAAKGFVDFLELPVHSPAGRKSVFKVKRG